MRTGMLARVAGRWALHRGLAMAVAALATLWVSGDVRARDQGARPAIAQAGQISFDIPPQPLTDALALFGRQSGMQVSVDAGLIRGVSSPGARGRMSAEDALRRLLAGTGITYRLTGDNTAMLERSEARDEGGPIRLDPITVEGTGQSYEGYRPTQSSLGTKTRTPILATPRSVQVVTPDVIRDQDVRGVDGLEEALRNVSGVTPANAFGGVEDAFFLRGFRINTGVFGPFSQGFFVDGVRSPLQRSFNANSESVEVLKGPSSALFGRAEPGGLVNVVRKRPLAEAQYEISGSGGTLETFNGYLDATGPIVESSAGTLAYRLVVEGDHAEYWRNVGRETERVLVAPTLSWDSERFRMTLGYEYSDSVQPFDRGTVILDGKPASVPYDRSFAEDFTRLDQENHFLRGDAEFDANDLLTLRLRASTSYSDTFDVQIRHQAFDQTTGELTRFIRSNEDIKGTQHFVGADGVFSFETGPLEHELVVGGDYYETDIDQGSQAISATQVFDIFDPVYGELRESDAVSLPNSGFDNRQTEYGAYVQNRVTWDKLTVFGGLRYANIDVFQQSGGFTFDDATTDVFLPSAGIVFQPQDWLSFYGSYSESFRPNASTPDGDGPFDPEEGVGVEAGAKAAFFDDQLLATFALFNIDKENVLINENGVTRAVGEVRSRGVELDVSGQVTPEIQVVATYTYLDSKVVENGGINEGNRLVDTPEHTASLFGTYRVQEGPLTGLRLGGGMIYVGDRPVDSANTVSLDDYVVFDAFVGFEDRIQNGPAYRIQLTAKNITGAEYYPYAFGTLNVGVGRPREIFLSASVRF